MATTDQIEAIRSKPVSERTDDEKAILQEADHPGADPKKQENMIPQSRLNEIIRERDEARQKAADSDKKLQDAETKRLQETNDYKALWEKAQTELSAVAPKAAQVDAYEKTLGDLLHSQIAEMPEDRRGLVPAALSTQQKLDWISANRLIPESVQHRRWAVRRKLIEQSRGTHR
jgi:hypothetical protein